MNCLMFKEGLIIQMKMTIWKKPVVLDVMVVEILS